MVRLKFSAGKLQEILDVASVVSRGARALFPEQPFVSLKPQEKMVVFESFGQESAVRFYYSPEGKKVDPLPATVAVPIREFRDLVSKMEGDVTLGVKSEDELDVECPVAKYSLRGLSEEEVAEFPFGKELPVFQYEFEGANLKRMLEQAIFPTTGEREVDYSRGVLWHQLPGALRIVTTDGFRLAMCEEKVAVEKEGKSILDSEGVRALARILPDDDTRIEISVGEKFARFLFPEFEYYVSLLNMAYPDYESIMQRETPHTFTLKREEMVKALSRVVTLTRSQARAYIALFSFTDREGVIEVESETLGKGRETLAGTLKGEGKTLALNCKYVMDYLMTLSEEQVNIAYKDTTSVCVFSPVGEGKSRYYLMPVKHPSIEG